MNFNGEHLLPGELGHFFVLLSLVSSLGAAISYFIAVQHKTPELRQSWKKLGRLFFLTDVLSVFAIFATIYFINSHHYYEYHYAWKHSSLSLEPKYLLSGIWEGQEGSFLLWTLWHGVLGTVFILREKEWESPVMTVISFAQFFLATMLIGITVFGTKIGSNPFILLRNTGLFDNAPVFHDTNGFMRQDYLSLIKDGNDLNPLLQNYWMVIHPPVLFLGFASTIVPFAFAIGGLWTKKFTEWAKPALPWALFSAGILGLGIMMGAAWAYESLNFGGYWAWDPVENASLVPWLVLVAGIHTLLIYRHTGNALRTAHIFMVLAFLLVLYSTYLTRSGDLQDTSVHAFTGEGITKWHLRIFLFVFLVPGIWMLFRNYRHIPFIVKEEETSSREFWMFVGSLVLFLSAVLIIGMTSIPIFNKIATLFTGREKVFTPLAVGEDAAFAYNRVQVYVAIILGVLTGIGMYLKYRTTGKAFLKKLWIPSIIAVAIAALILAFGEINYRDKGPAFMAAVWVAVLAAVYSVVMNAEYIATALRGSIKKAGGAIAHVGFALMLVGILVSSSKKEVLSYNTTGIMVPFGKDSKQDPGENLTLIKGVRTDMGKYWVTYDKDSMHPQKPLWFYHLQFTPKDGGENFSLSPNAFVNYKGNAALMANPDSKHYLTYDIFTYITSLADPDKTKDTASLRAHTLKVGDTLFYSKGYAVMEELSSIRNIPGIEFGTNDSASIASIKVFAKTGSLYTSKPVLINKGGGIFSQPDTITAEGLVFQLQRVNGKTAQLGVKESDAILQYVTLKAYKFPFILVLWLGTIIMVVGFMISMFWRVQTNRKKAMATGKGTSPAAGRKAVKV